MSKNTAIYFKIKPGEHPSEIARKLAGIPEEFWLTNIKSYDFPEGRRLVMLFVWYPDMSLDELLDAPRCEWPISREIT